MKSPSFKVRVIKPVQTSLHQNSGEIRAQYFNVFLISTTSKEKILHKVDNEIHSAMFEEILLRTKNWKVYPQTIRNYRITGLIRKIQTPTYKTTP